jgi:hypothetical protein
LQYFQPQCTGSRITANELAVAPIRSRSVEPPPPRGQAFLATIPRPGYNYDMAINVHATYRDGLIHPVHPLNLPEGTELELTVEAADPPTSPVAANTPTPARIFSPKLVHPEQIADFQMEFREISDAGV